MDDEEEDEEVLKDLIEQVKEAQSSSRDVNQAWNEYCNNEGDGTRDPRRHPASFLRRFLESIDDGPSPPRGGKGRGRADEEEEDDDPLGLPWKKGKSREKRWQESSWDELVQFVRSSQSGSRRTNELWNDFCDAEGGGTRDPSRHNTAFLREFLASLDGWESKGARKRDRGRDREWEREPAVHLEPKAPKWAEQQQRKSEGEKSDLTSQVQAALASSRQVQDAWNEFCDTKGCGIRDATRHVASFLQRFLSSLGRDAPAAAPAAAPVPTAAGAGAGLGDDLVHRVRTAQLSSRHAREAWARLCDSTGGGVRDPGRHAPCFLRQFLNSLDASGKPRNPWDEEREQRSQKRAREVPRRMPKEEESEDEGKESLIVKVKAIQSSSMRVSEKWNDFCMDHGGGTLDPSRHDAEFLRSFLASLPGQWRRDRRAKADLDEDDDQPRWQRRARPRREEVQEVRPQETKQDLIEQIKRLQRASSQNTDAWRDFCNEEGGGTCDPSRHPFAFLQRFLERMAE